MGLALSGGGIRSATFALGVIQALSELELLRRFDYLSTVSGGGYIGSWLAAWIKREGSVENVEQQLIPKRSDQAQAIRGFACEPDVICADGHAKTVLSKLEKGDIREDEPQPISHLRQYSNYLAPRASLFSGDTWTLIAVYLRNLLANQMALIPMVFIIILVVRAYTTIDSYFEIVGTLLWLLGLFLTAMAYRKIASGLSTVVEKTQGRSSGDQKLLYQIVGMSWGASMLMAWSLISPFNIILWKGVDSPIRVILWYCLPSFIQEGVRSFDGGVLLISSLAFGALHAGMSLFRKNSEDSEVPKFYHFLTAFLGGASAGAFSYLILQQFLWKPEVSLGAYITFGPALLQLSFTLASVVEISLMGTYADEQEREWWSRLIAWQLIISIVWMLAVGLILFGPLWIYQLGMMWKAGVVSGWVLSTIGGVLAAKSNRSNGQDKAGSPALNWISMVGPVVFLVGLVALLSVGVDHLLNARYSTIVRSRLSAAQLEGTSKSLTDLNAYRNHIMDGMRKSSIQTQPARVHQTIQERHVDKNPNTVTEVWRTTTEIPSDDFRELSFRHWSRQAFIDWTAWTIFFAICFALVFIASWCVDTNEFSLNAMYANRLTACYLGASRRSSRPKTRTENASDSGQVLEVVVPDGSTGTVNHAHGSRRNPHSVTGFDNDDDLCLKDLQFGKKDDEAALLPAAEALELKEDVAKIRYVGPFPLINTALNLVSGDQLAWQERMAESFVLSPLNCGCKSLGYQPTKEYAAGKITLGRAVSVSGAAASPNMGYHSSPIATALLTIFNVRLGWWVPNPSLEKEWKTRGPSFLLYWLGIEMFGLTNSRTKFLNISDGGHFENLGVYELVRRRCRCIIVSDAGADPGFEFEDLAGMIRKCRTDFGIDIEIDTTPLTPDPETGLTKAHCIVGTIRYDMVDPTAPTGLLLYLKPSLTGEESEDIRQYKRSHADFPHQPTLDQFFTESQFESYRALGYHCGKKALDEVCQAIQERGANDNDCTRFDSWTVRERQENLVENLVWRLKKQWLPYTTELDDGFRRSTDQFLEFQSNFNQDGANNRRLLDLYPELTTSGDGKTSVISSEDFTMVVEMIQLMENAWLDVRLDQQAGHPLNSGWLNLFRRWAQYPHLQGCWPLLRNEFSTQFVDFCERVLGLSKGDFVWSKQDECPAGWSRLIDEFHRECQHKDPNNTNNANETPDPLFKDWMTNLEDARQKIPMQTLALSVQVDMPGDGVKRKQQFLVGFIGVREITDRHPKQLRTQFKVEIGDKKIYELIGWVRPAFRQRGIGTELIQKVLIKNGLEIAGKFPNDHTLVIRHPIAPWKKPGSAIEKAGWLSFVSFYGFRPLQIEGDDRYHWMVRRPT